MISIFSQPFLIYSSLKRGTKAMKAVHRRVIRITVRRESSVPYRIWAEAENRLHVQKAILAWCLGA